MKQTKILIGVIIILALAIGVLAWANGRSVAELEPATLVVKVKGEEVGSITLEEIMELGSEDFSMVLRSSGSEPKENTYTGVALAEVLEAVQPGLVSAESQVSVRAVDGYAVVYTGEEMLHPQHIYLVWLKDGKPLGSKADGGSGPLLVIPRQHEFGQFWCKFAVEVDLR